MLPDRWAVTRAAVALPLRAVMLVVIACQRGSVRRIR